MGSYNGYDFWIGISLDIGPPTYFYNITPEGGLPPEGGYPSKDWIEKKKGVRFPMGEATYIHHAIELGVVVLDKRLTGRITQWAPIPQWEEMIDSKGADYEKNNIHS